ncbi:DUF4402 domain-containing protein [Aurantiacibacter luteus]|nr:DUF4402 domain-containing protein [Aurantiacibacter luteus]
MKKFAVLSAVALTALATPAFAAPGDSDSADGAATAQIVSPITLTHVAGAVLDFGTFTTGDTGGTIVVTRGGAGTASGEVALLQGSLEAADQFTVSGDAGRRFSITTGGGSVSNGAATPTTMAFTTDARANHTLDTAGAASFSVGGTLTVLGGEPAGTYTGSYAVTVAYN